MNEVVLPELGENIETADVRLTNTKGSLLDQDYKNLAAHELGHAIGLRHRGGPGTMMFRSLIIADEYPPLSRADQRLLGRLYD